MFDSMRIVRTEPGDRAPAPGPLRLVQLFVNPNDLEGGPELLPDSAALRDWLVARDLLGADEPVNDDDHARAIELREAIRELVSAHAGLPHDPAAGEIVNVAGRPARPRPLLPGPPTRVEPPARGGGGAP